MSESFSQLEALVSGLCPEVGIHVREGRCFAYCAREGVITVPADTVERLGPTTVAGILAHEVGHVWVSRYHDFRPWRTDLPELIAANTLNCLEDPRVEQFMFARYPGVRRWIQQAHAAPTVELHQKSHTLVSAAWVSLLTGEVPKNLFESGAFEGFTARIKPVLEARNLYVQSLPPITSVGTDEPNPGEVEAYTQAVTRLMSRTRKLPLGPQYEARVVASAYLALQIAEEQIFPWMSSLFESEIDRVAMLCGRDPLDLLTLDHVANTLAIALDGAPPEILEPPSRGLRQRVRNRLLVLYGGRSAGLDMARPIRVDTAARPTTQSYEQLQRQSAPYVASLVSAIRDELPNTSRSRLQAGYYAGNALDVRRAMTFARDTSRMDVFAQRTKKTTPKVAFGLLVDLSGSMRGKKIEAALVGAVLMIEALRKLECACAVWGFQDVLIPIIAANTSGAGGGSGASLTAAQKQRVVEMRLEVAGRRLNGNNAFGFNDDGPCLESACKELTCIPADRHVMVVLSDGRPEGTQSGEPELHQAVRWAKRQGIVLAGMGLGPGTEHVREFYPNAVGSVPLGEVPKVLGGILRAWMG